MTFLATLHRALVAPLDAMAPAVLPTLARFLFAAVLFGYYWNSALTKLGDGVFGVFSPSFGAYTQIFPKAMEAVSYDITQLSVWHYLVVLAGTWAEFILPVLLVVGLATRPAALGMIGFIVVQSWVDVVGHGVDAQTIGQWFDRDASSAILDQRGFWVFPLVYLVMRGAGPLSLDRLVARRFATDDPTAGAVYAGRSAL